MAKRNGFRQGMGGKVPPALRRVTACGYKSLATEQSIEIRPLTILAGANSSGKSSMMQPLLLLKQTLESSYDPGAILLNGANVKFTSADQLLWRAGKDEGGCGFSVGAELDGDHSFKVHFHRDSKKRLDFQKIEYKHGDAASTFSLNMTNAEIKSEMATTRVPPDDVIDQMMKDLKFTTVEWRTARDRFFLNPEVVLLGTAGKEFSFFQRNESALFEQMLLSIIHLPGLRGNPERNYPVTAIGSVFPGTFENYVASIIAQWSADKDQEKLDAVGNDLAQLGLTWKVSSDRINDTQVELKVGRLVKPSRGGARDLVSIADVGFGVSQTLPVVVGLQTADRNQLVYIEQPEIHLHPRAQLRMASLLASAARRGVRVVVETHSSILLLGIQTLVAKGELAAEGVKLHWFERSSDDGSTSVRSADLDASGAFGDWPEDFADVSLEAENQFLSLLESRRN